jgi:hypothetical protein
MILHEKEARNKNLDNSHRSAVLIKALAFSNVAFTKIMPKSLELMHLIQSEPQKLSVLEFIN